LASTRDIPVMPLDAVALVLLSAVFHATWNFLLKRSGGTQEVVALSKLAEVIVLAPVFLVGFATGLPSPGESAWWAGVAALGVALTYIALARAYRHGDLSFVYPIARGSILVFLPVAGWIALGEHLSVLGAAGLAAIVAGIITLNLDGFDRAALRRVATVLRGKATVFAVLAGLTSAVFTIWDKRAIGRMAPFAYMYLYTLIVAIGFGLWLKARVAPDVVRQTWRRHWPSIVLIGLLNTASYLLILFALRTGVTSYVLGMRQVSIAGGVALGWWFLQEQMTRGRRVGGGRILTGGLTLSVAAGG